MEKENSRGTQKTPIAFRTHVSIFGSTNAGKSSLFNALIGQDMMIVSEKSGTTTDPVTKAMELLPYGPIALTDTAGLGDETSLGSKREEKTEKILDKTDFAIYAADIAAFDEDTYNKTVKAFDKRKIGHMLVFTKSDTGAAVFAKKYPDAISVSVYDEKSIENLKNVLQRRLSEIAPDESTMIGGLLPDGATVVHVIPIDSEAPKGRIILPQVQLIRDCLDHGMRSIVVRDMELKETIAEYRDKIDLVVTDSQAFKFVAEVVPEEIPLTSYSMLMARMKGDLIALIKGADRIENLKDGSRILMAEACTHNSSHEDIGRVKIPRLLRQKTGKTLEFEYYTHYDFPKNLSDYDLIIHCGGCMINSRAMMNRIEFAASANVPITNYGVVLAYVSGILDRAKEIFIRNSANHTAL